MIFWNRVAPGRIRTLILVSACAANCLIAHATSSITTNELAAGRFATVAYIHDSGKPGPTVFICGGAHGNEPAGSLAAENIRHWPITAGKLVVIPRANVLALTADKRLIPNLGTNLSNLNRNFPHAGETEPARGELAQAIWELALAHKPDWVLDLHEGYDFSRRNGKSVGSSIICFPIEKAQIAADLMITAVNASIAAEQFRFRRLNLPIDGSLARAAGEHLGVPGMTLETTSKQPMEKRVRQHEVMVDRLFQYLGMIKTTPRATLVGTERNPVLRIAVYKGPGTGGDGPPNLLKKFDRALDYSISSISPEEIQANTLTNFHVVIFAGGSGSKQAGALGDAGRANVRHFVEHGGGYIGICAGAYLATSGFSWSLKLINARTVSPKWQRGKGPVEIELTETGSGILGRGNSSMEVLYANGPIVTPDEQTDLPTFETLAYFRTELARNGTPVGVMSNSPAIFAAPYKRGRVLCISPHPEQTAGLEELVPRAVEWVAMKADSVSQK
jgi:predicted deacylase